MTQQDLQDAVVTQLTALFAHMRRKNSLGTARGVAVYAQDLPVRAADDEGEDREAPPEPFVVVRLRGGRIEDETSPHVVELVLVICVFDPDPNRQGCRDALHIVNEIYRHFATNGIIAGRYAIQYPIEWAVQEEDTHPYYYAGMTLTAELPAYTKEVPEL